MEVEGEYRVETDRRLEDRSGGARSRLQPVGKGIRWKEKEMPASGNEAIIREVYEAFNGSGGSASMRFEGLKPGTHASPPTTRHAVK